MNKYIQANRALWNEFTPIHKRSKYYDVEGFLAGKNSLKSIELELLGETKDKSILHLQCHFGMDSLSLARLGAKVTGVDISDKAIELARELCKATALEAQFIPCDIYQLNDVLEETYDIIFTSYGVLCWLHDLSAWAETIYKHLKPGGKFLIVEQHPLLNVFDQNEKGIEISYSYFDKKTLELEVNSSYASDSDDDKIDTRISYEWVHTMAEIVNALTGSGLTIENLHEYPFCMYKRFEVMKETQDGWWIFEDMPELPLLFAIEATN